MPDWLLITAIGLILAMLTALPFVRRRMRLEARARAAAGEAERYGLSEPASLHPVIDLNVCSGCAACVAVCPEGDVLGLVGGQARVIQPARCVGHGLCQRSCPTDAIQLVFGTAERGVDLPRIDGNYETNVPGLFIVGELGGMGLVKNAFEQGRQCVDWIARNRQDPPEGGVELAVVGCGPAGLSATITARRHGLSCVTLEKEPSPGGAVRRYPRRKLVMTRPFEIPGWGKIRTGELPKEDLVSAWQKAVRELDLQIRTGVTVDRVEAAAEGFVIHSSAGPVLARRVILAIGRRGIPRRLGVPGEDGDDVYYSLAEPEQFAGRRTLVVGGGDSAVEAALMLSDQPDTSVHLSYRRDALSRVKPANLERFERATQSGAVTPLWSSEVEAIGPGSVTIRADADARTLPVDDVFIMIGGQLPTAFLESCGIAMDTLFGQPR